MAQITLLEKRRLTKAKKPTFSRQESHRKKKLGDEWRRPRGMHSKMRLHQRGKKGSPETGWGSPREVEGLHPSGLRPVLVSTTRQIDSLKAGEGAVLASTLGMKKRSAIAELAKKKNIIVLNFKIDSLLKSVSEKMAKRKSSKKKSKLAAPTPSKDEAKDVKKEEQKEQPADSKPNDEEQKRKEKEEQDRLLTKRV